MKCFWRQQAASLTVEVSGVDLQAQRIKPAWTAAAIGK